MTSKPQIPALVTSAEHVAPGRASKRAAARRAKVDESKSKLDALNAERRAASDALDAAKHAATEPAAARPIDERLARLAEAKSESEALKAWQKNPVGERPQTPNLDAVNEKLPVNGKSSSTKSKSTPRPKQSSEIVFVLDGRTKRRLASLAYDGTIGLASDGKGRLSTTELRSLLVELGVEHPERSEWSRKLPNGRRVGAHLVSSKRPLHVPPPVISLVS